ncbi:hypothetical protein [Paenibacillus donghaensis]|uniref:Uncharacterized protein n=1 Tax=Paenibacillus donghaensis TaxID=414771 RepID=A0A2Z2KMX9_9BACL|nr:hypothetical protein [Paenibacillus donghaensis]ASA22512.1 hypothetical protein B9T62_18020 [Paenibacillus donghaensis]
MPVSSYIWEKSETLSGARANGLYLYQDNTLIVTDTKDTLDTAPYKDSAVVSKYTTSGELLWENDYPAIELQLMLGNMVVDADGFIAFTAITTSQISGTANYQENVKLIGVNADSETKINKKLVSSTDTVPVSYSTPILTKGHIY